MAQKKEIDFSEFYVVLEKVDRRVTALEKDSEFVEERIASMIDKKAKSYASMQTEFKNLKNLVADTRNQLKVCIIEMIKLSDELKDSIKKDQMSSLSEKLDELKFEEYVSKKDLKRKLSEI